MFAERGGAWERLDDQGQATGDGQFVVFNHPGGTVAAGVNTRFANTDRASESSERGSTRSNRDDPVQLDANTTPSRFGTSGPLMKTLPFVHDSRRWMAGGFVASWPAIMPAGEIDPSIVRIQVRLGRRGTSVTATPDEFRSTGSEPVARSIDCH